MTSEQDADPGPAHAVGDGVHLEAHVSGAARAYQAGRDLHVRLDSRTSRVRRAEGADVVEECPYPGLAAFGPEDARWFFGRDTLLAELTGLLSQPPARARWCW